MSDSCCQVFPAAPALCPTSKTRGTSVEWLTVAALTKVPVPPRQAFWLCRESSCNVAYFGEHGTTISGNELRLVPGFKDESDDGLLCYCFNVSGAEIERELRTTGATNVIERITDEVKAKNCACEVRNPSGKCCLGELKEGVAAIKKRLTMSTTGRG